MMLGYQPSELSEAALLGCVHPADLTTMRRTVTSHATKGGATAREPPPTMTVRIRAKDGLYVPLKLPMHPVMDGSKASSLIGALPRLQFAASPRRPRSNVSSAASSSNDLAAAADGAPPAPEALLVAALLRARRLGAHVFTAPALAEHTPRLLESLGFFAGDGATHLEIHDAAAADGEAAAGEDALPSDLKAEEVAWLPFL